MKLLLILAIFSISLSSFAQSIWQRIQPPFAMAHQGGIFKLKPNTIWQFKNAIKKGVNGLEMDLRVTKDGVAVVYHNETLNYFTKCKGKVMDYTYEHIHNKCKLITGPRISSFSDVLKTVNGKAVINAEFKELEVVGPAIRELQKFAAHDWVFFQTKGGIETYNLARSFDPRVALLFRIQTNEDFEMISKLNDPYLIVYEMDKDMLTKDHVDRAHAAGKYILADTWNFTWDYELFTAGCKKAFKQGVDIGVTNNPKRCQKQGKNYLKGIPEEDPNEEGDEEN